VKRKREHDLSADDDRVSMQLVIVVYPSGISALCEALETAGLKLLMMR